MSENVLQYGCRNFQHSIQRKFSITITCWHFDVLTLVQAFEGDDLPVLFLCCNWMGTTLLLLQTHARRFGELSAPRVSSPRGGGGGRGICPDSAEFSSS